LSRAVHKTYFVLLLACYVGIISDIQGQSNEGREFWLGFMEHRDAGQNDMVVMISSRKNTTGTVNMPSRNFSREFQVQANDVTIVKLPRFVETIGSEKLDRTAIKITSEADISVYMHQYFGNRSEASVVLPKSSVSNEYYVVSYTGVPEGLFGPGIFPSEFLIVANEDETEVSYTLGADTQGGKTEGSTHTIMLNAGEVYQVRSADALEDLTSTYVTGDKDFSLFAGTSWSQVPLGCIAMDNLMEQMYPISTWGTKYVASPFNNTINDVFRVIAAEDNTSVIIDAVSRAEVTLDAGETHDFDSAVGAIVQSNKPISVAQYMTGSTCNGGQGDPSMVILNTVEQIRDTVTLFNSQFFNIFENYINIITKAGEEDLVSFDDSNMVSFGSIFLPIGDSEEFVYTVRPTSAGAHTIHTTGCGIIAMAYGYGDLESYAYSGGASFTEINRNPIPEGGCLSDTLVFDTGLPPDRFNVRWDLGDGTTSIEHEFEHIYAKLGDYNLSVIIEDICFDEIDTLERVLSITLRQDIIAIEDQSGCAGTTITLGAFDLEGAQFEWLGPDDYTSSNQFPEIRDISSAQGGLYEVVGNVSGCKTVPADVFVEVLQRPQVSLGPDIVLCPVDRETAVLTPGDFSTYRWQDASTGSDFFVSETGTYTVEVTDANGCIGIDSLAVVSQCSTRFYMPTAFSPNGDRINDLFGVSGIEIISMNLRIFDRWGEEIFTSKQEEVKWDGTFRGQAVADGEYMWTLEYQGYDAEANIFEAQEAGTILVIR